MTFADFIPPIFGKLAAFVPQSSGVYTSWSEALTYCSASDYQSDEIVEVVRGKTRRLAAHRNDPHICAPSGPGLPNVILSALLAGCAAQTPTIRILDIGGACGTHYFAARSSLRTHGLRWCVLETVAMASAAAEFENEELHFSASLEAALDWLGGVDLVHASSVLQYFPDPVAMLRTLTEIPAPVMLVSRLPLTDAPAYTIVQRSRLAANGPGPLPEGMRDKVVSYPVSFMNRSVFEDTVTQRRTIQASYLDSGGNYRTPKELIQGRTYVLTPPEQKNMKYPNKEGLQ